ncbi:MAG: J domain-containing protein [Roseibium sp.]|nr:J domain-containing protein [Roseibium sp.]
MTHQPTAYPLAWPAGWPRTPAYKRNDSKYQFRKRRAYANQSPFWSFAESRDALVVELERLGARNPVLSSNFQLRLDGLPSGSASRPADEGIAIFFELKGRPMVMACDVHVRAEENMRSLALSIEAMRALERHGGGVMMEKAFDGFAALPPPSSDNRPHWSAVLDLPRNATRSDIEKAFKHKARAAHPDHGGSNAQMAALNAARDEALGAAHD